MLRAENLGDQENSLGSSGPRLIMSRKTGMIMLEDVPVVEFVYLVFTCMPGKRYRRLLLYVCYV